MYLINMYLYDGYYIIKLTGKYNGIATVDKRLLLIVYSDYLNEKKEQNAIFDAINM